MHLAAPLMQAQVLDLILASKWGGLTGTITRLWRFPPAIAVAIIVINTAQILRTRQATSTVSLPSEQACR